MHEVDLQQINFSTPTKEKINLKLQTFRQKTFFVQYSNGVYD